jgi:protein-S-isoprenylcysteine O-methyltransferase Ste14
MTLFVLYMLATLDGGLCGFRAFAGRSALIYKRMYYARAVVRGAVAAQAASFLSLFVLLLTVAVSNHRAELRADLESAAGRMLWVFLPYAAAVITNLALRALPSTDIRASTSVMVLGPLTGLRPFVMIGGVLYGIGSARLLETCLLGAFVLVVMLSLETLLNRVAARMQERDLASAR